MMEAPSTKHQAPEKHQVPSARQVRIVNGNRHYLVRVEEDGTPCMTTDPARAGWFEPGEARRIVRRSDWRLFVEEPAA